MCVHLFQRTINEHKYIEKGSAPKENNGIIRSFNSDMVVILDQ
jgi:hypothetical protein